MANEIDLYKDLSIAERGYKLAKKENNKQGKIYWKKSIKLIKSEIRELYPDLLWENIK